MTDAINILRAVSGLLWVLTAIYFLPAVWRIAWLRQRYYDPMKAVFVFLACANLGFIMRWYVWPSAQSSMGSEELATWAGMYVLSSLSALGLFFVSRAYRVGHN